MHHLHAALAVLALSACATQQELPNSTIYDSGAPRAEVDAAVASVQLIQDCPDPPEVAASWASAPSAGPMAKPTVEGDAPAWSPPCTQSTVQLALTNNGVIPGKLQVVGVRLLEGASKRELGRLAARKPNLWTEEGIYRPWDETLAEGAHVVAAYRLGEPDWSQVQGLLAPGANLYAIPLILEIELSVDGAIQTLRSPEFLRQEVFMVAT